MDEVYAYRLMSYMKSKSTIPYEIMVFTEKNALLAYLSENEAEVLLTNDEEILSGRKEWKVRKVLKLSEEQILDSIGESMEYHPVFKYQSTENVIKEMLCYCAGGIMPQASRCRSLKGKILGIYSPVGKCHKTTFSLALANALGKNARVLYLNLEEYTGLSDSLLQKGKKSLSEIMYMYRRGSSGISMRIQEITGHLGRFDYIPPVDCPEDVVDVLPEEWTTFCTYLMENLDYDFLVIDIGNLVKKPWYFFELADVIFIPEVKDSMGKNKIKEFYDDMNNMGRGILLENVSMITMPHDTEMEKGILSMEQIEWSKMGAFARKVVNERGF